MITRVIRLELADAIRGLKVLGDGSKDTKRKINDLEAASEQLQRAELEGAKASRLTAQAMELRARAAGLAVRAQEALKRGDLAGQARAAAQSELALARATEAAARANVASAAAEKQRARALEQVEEAQRRAGRSSSGFLGGITRITGALGRMLGPLALAAGAWLSFAGVFGAASSFVSAAEQLERVTATLEVATGSGAGAAEEWQFVSQASDALGLSLAATSGQYGSLAVAARGTSLAGDASRAIFVAVTEAMTALRRPAEETEGALNAIQQMMSKGKVQAEELRGQLGERLPGAFQLAAKAMGVTTGELDKMLDQGKVTADVLLPRLAAALHETFGEAAVRAADRPQAAMNRLNNSLLILKATAGEELAPAIGDIAAELARLAADPAAGKFFGDLGRLMALVVRGGSAVIRSWDDIRSAAAIGQAAIVQAWGRTLEAAQRFGAGVVETVGDLAAGYQRILEAAPLLLDPTGKTHEQLEGLISGAKRVSAGLRSMAADTRRSTDLMVASFIDVADEQRQLGGAAKATSFDFEALFASLGRSNLPAVTGQSKDQKRALDELVAAWDRLGLALTGAQLEAQRYGTVAESQRSTVEDLRHELEALRDLVDMHFPEPLRIEAQIDLPTSTISQGRFQDLTVDPLEGVLFHTDEDLERWGEDVRQTFGQSLHLAMDEFMPEFRWSLADAAAGFTAALMEGLPRIAAGMASGQLSTADGSLNRAAGDLFMQGMVAALGPWGAVVGALFADSFRSGADEAFAELSAVNGQLQVTANLANAIATAWQQDLNPALEAMADTIIKTTNQILAEFGGTLQSATVGFKIRRGPEEDVVRVFYLGLVREFEDEAAATSFLIAKIIAEGVVTGFSASVAEAVRHGEFESVDELLAAMDFARSIDDALLGPFDLFFEQVTRASRVLLQAAADLGINLDRATAAAVRNAQAQLDQAGAAVLAAGGLSSMVPQWAELQAQISKVTPAAVAAFEAELRAVAEQALASARAAAATAQRFDGSRDAFEEWISTLDATPELANRLRARFDELVASGASAEEIVAELTVSLQGLSVDQIRAATEAFRSQFIGSLFSQLADLAERTGRTAAAAQLRAKAEEFHIRMQILGIRMTVAQAHAEGLLTTARAQQFQALIRDAQQAFNEVMRSGGFGRVGRGGGGRRDEPDASGPDAAAQAAEEFGSAVARMTAELAGATPEMLATADAMARLREQGTAAGKTTEEIARALSLMAELQLRPIAAPWQEIALAAGETSAQTAFRQAGERAAESLAAAAALEAANPEVYAEVRRAVEQGLDASLGQIGQDALLGLAGEATRLQRQGAGAVAEIAFLVGHLRQLGLTAGEVASAITDAVLPGLLDMAIREAERAGLEEEAAALRSRRAEIERQVALIQLDVWESMLRTAGALTAEREQLIATTREWLALPSAEPPVDESHLQAVANLRQALTELVDRGLAPSHAAIRQASRAYAELVRRIDETAESEAERAAALAIADAELARAHQAAAVSFLGEVETLARAAGVELPVEQARQWARIQLEVSRAQLLVALSSQELREALRGLGADVGWVQSFISSLDFAGSVSTGSGLDPAIEAQLQAQIDEMEARRQAQLEADRLAAEAAREAAAAEARRQEEIAGILTSFADAVISGSERQARELIERRDRLVALLTESGRQDEIGAALESFAGARGAFVDELLGRFEGAGVDDATRQFLDLRSGLLETAAALQTVGASTDEWTRFLGVGQGALDAFMADLKAGSVAELEALRATRGGPVAERAELTARFQAAVERARGGELGAVREVAELSQRLRGLTGGLAGGELSAFLAVLEAGNQAIVDLQAPDLQSDILGAATEQLQVSQDQLGVLRSIEQGLMGGPIVGLAGSGQPVITVTTPAADVAVKVQMDESLRSELAKLRSEVSDLRKAVETSTKGAADRVASAVRESGRDVKGALRTAGIGT